MISRCKTAFSASILFVLVSIGPCCGGALAGGIEAPPIDTRGAVLCHWSIAITQKTIGEACFKKRGADYLASMDWAISRMDAFILRNSKTTQAQLDKNKTKVESEIRKNIEIDSKGQCTPGQGALAFYPQSAKLRERVAVEIWIRDLLAVPRPPVMNPCL